MGDGRMEAATRLGKRAVCSEASGLLSRQQTMPQPSPAHRRGFERANNRVPRGDPPWPAERPAKASEGGGARRGSRGSPRASERRPKAVANRKQGRESGRGPGSVANRSARERVWGSRPLSSAGRCLAEHPTVARPFLRHTRRSSCGRPSASSPPTASTAEIVQRKDIGAPLRRRGFESLSPHHPNAYCGCSSRARGARRTRMSPLSQTPARAQNPQGPPGGVMDPRSIGTARPPRRRVTFAFVLGGSAPVSRETREARRTARAGDRTITRHHRTVTVDPRVSA